MHDELFEDKYICNATAHMASHLSKQGMNIDGEAWNKHLEHSSRTIEVL